MDSIFVNFTLISFRNKGVISSNCDFLYISFLRSKLFSSIKESIFFSYVIIH
jgi:hypothetical protein